MVGTRFTFFYEEIAAGFVRCCCFMCKRCEWHIYHAVLSSRNTCRKPLRKAPCRCFQCKGAQRQRHQTFFTLSMCDAWLDLMIIEGNVCSVRATHSILYTSGKACVRSWLPANLIYRCCKMNTVSGTRC